MALEREYDFAIAFRPVLPIAVRIPGFFKRVNPKWPPYVGRDCYRLAQMAGMTFGPPRPDPIVMDFASGEVATEQPYIYRLTRLGQAAAEAGRGLPFAVEVSQLIWGGHVQGWDQGDHLAQATARAGLDLAALEHKASAEAERLDGAIAANQETLDNSGHWGVPTMVFEGEPFFGQDRIDALIWRMGQRGLKKR
jgi:2-hydroxychromene-2-carboxylate isomerase